MYKISPLLFAVNSAMKGGTLHELAGTGHAGRYQGNMARDLVRTLKNQYPELRGLEPWKVPVVVESQDSLETIDSFVHCIAPHELFASAWQAGFNLQNTFWVGEVRVVPTYGGIVSLVRIGYYNIRRYLKARARLCLCAGTSTAWRCSPTRSIICGLTARS